MNIIKKLIAIYVRVSTLKQEEEQTIKNQIMVLKEYAKKHNYEIIEEYIDDGWSGDTLARPELDRLRQEAKDKKWEAVLIYDPDRLARRYSYQELVCDELREAGIEVMFITVSAPKNSEDKILHGVRGLFAEYERAKISERFRLGKLRKIKSGHILVSEALYGYKYILKSDKVEGHYIIFEEEARIVRMIFHWVADKSMTLRTVVRELNRLGIKPRKSKRGVWNTSTLSTMLRNEAYIGNARWGSSEAVVPERPQNKEKYKRNKKTSRKIKPRNEWYTVSVPSIIDKEVFYRARRQMEKNYQLCNRNKKNEYLLSGLIYCSCGRRRSGEGAMGGKHLYYRCTDRVLSYPLPKKCNECGLNARIADKLVWNKFVELITSPELMTRQAERYFNQIENRIENTLGNTDDIEKQIKKLKEEELRYNKAYGAGVFSLEDLKEYTEPIREKILSLEKEIVNIKSEQGKVNNNNIANKEDIKKFAKETPFMLESFSFNKKREIVLSSIDKIVGTQSHLSVYGKIPVTNYEFKTNHRHSRFTKCGEINPI